jgi:hypothetical protein
MAERIVATKAMQSRSLVIGAGDASDIVNAQPPYATAESLQTILDRFELHEEAEHMIRERMTVLAHDDITLTWADVLKVTTTELSHFRIGVCDMLMQEGKRRKWHMCIKPP